MADSALFAWTVVRLPSWPVFMAWSMSRASGPRHSPTTILSGFMRSAFFTHILIVTAPVPLAESGRDPMATTCASGCRRSSSASSMVMIRSSRGMHDDKALSSDVLWVGTYWSPHRNRLDALSTVMHRTGRVGTGRTDTIRRAAVRCPIRSAA